MADRPRLKKTDEILGSIVTETSRTPKRAGESSSRQTSSGQQPKSQQPDFEFDEEDIELNDQPSLPSAQTLAEKLMARENRKRLNFDRYELPKHVPAPVPANDTAPVSVTIPIAENPTQASVTIPTPAANPAAASVTVPEPAPARRNPATTSQAAPPEIAFDQPSAPATVVTEYTFQSFEAQEDKHPVVEFHMGSDDSDNTEQRRSPRERSRRRFLQQAENAGNINPPDESEFEPQFDFEPSATPRAQAYSEPQAEPRPAPKHRTAPDPGPEPPYEPADEDPLKIEERNRQDFLKRIANQFELQFEERFEEGTLPSRDALKRSRDDRPAVKPPTAKPAPVPRQEPEPVFAPFREEPQTSVSVDDQDGGEDFLSFVQRQERERQATPKQPKSAPPPAIAEEDAPATDFIAKFQQDIHNEERQRSDDFKDTLAEKFERERERYLKELDIQGDEPDEPENLASAAPQQRRRLDFQIQPEMHVRGGEAAPILPAKPSAPTGPVTYTRGGGIKPLVSLDDEISSMSISPTKKTTEQLLMEHGVRAKIPAIPISKPDKLNFTFSTPEEQAKSKKKSKEPLLPTEKWPRRIVLIAMAASLFAIVLLMWPLIKYMELASSLTSTPEAPVSEALPVNEDVLNVYNDLSYTQTAKANNVMFKNANVTLRNVDVNDYVVIEGIDTTGKIRLEDVSVNTAVSVKSCGIDTLELHNVQTDRLIINNASTDMTISATGRTEIGVVELRTPATVGQSEIPVESSGVRSMVITPAESGGSINAKLNGLSLLTLDLSASESVIAFENSTRAETVSSDGSLSLTGDGKIVNLAIGAKSGLGAGDIEDSQRVTLFIKGVTVTNLNIKSPANLNLATTVDNVSTSDAALIGGEGNVGALTLNPKSGSSGRLLIDIAGLNIQSLYSNVQSRVNITGSARVNMLTADESTFVLGNKVNHLKANADGVIYENEPDRTITAEGIRPPQSKAENPNLDYNVSGSEKVIDTTGEDFATTCEHSRESGGFLLGDGSMDAPYEVSSPAHLAHVSAHLGSYFIQTADMDISTDSRFAGGFPMIGSSISPFTGSFDGNGFAITKIRIISSEENVGLFSTNKGLIQNVRLVSGEIGSSSSNPSFIGGIAGLNTEGGSIRSCSNGASINGNQHTYTGGIVGYNFGAKVHDCYNYANVSGVDIVGGLVGYNRQGATLTGSYNAGIIDGRDEVGGVAGKNEGSTIANCYYHLDTADIGIGDGTGTATEKTSAELQDPQMAADLSAGNETSLWISGEAGGGAYRYPVHRKPSPAA